MIRKTLLNAFASVMSPVNPPPPPPSPAAFDSGGGGKAAQAERRIAEAKARDKVVVVKKKAPEGVVGIQDDKATFKPGASTWNTDMEPESHVKKDDTPQWPDPVNPYEEWQPAGTGQRTAARCAERTESPCPASASGVTKRFDCDWVGEWRVAGCALYLRAQPTYPTHAPRIIPSGRAPSGTTTPAAPPCAATVP